MIDVKTEITEILEEPTATTLKRKQLKNGRYLSRGEAIEAVHRLQTHGNQEKLDHFMKIARIPGGTKLPGKQYSLWRELGL